MAPLRTAVLLPHRERYSVSGAGAIALTVAGQLVDEDARRDGAVEVWGDPFEGTSLLDASRATYVPMHLSRLWPGRRSWRYRRAVLKALRQRAPDRLEIHNRATLFHALSPRPIRLALYLHNDPWSIRGLKAERERAAVLRRADYVVCVSGFLKQRFCAGLSPEDCGKVQVVPNTVAVDRLNTETEKQPEILFVGRLIPEKGALPLIEALGRVLPTHPDWTARMVGAWHFGQTQPRFAHEHDIQAAAEKVGSSLQMLGYQTFDQVVTAFNRAAIVVVPSLWQEPFGRTALEAMAAGCAVVASNRGGLPEVVGDAGVLVDPEPESLAAALNALIDDPERRFALGRLAAERARTVFAPQRVHDRIRALRQGGGRESVGSDQ